MTAANANILVIEYMTKLDYKVRQLNIQVNRD